MKRFPETIQRGRVIRAERIPSEHGDDFKTRWIVVLAQRGDEVYGVVSTARQDERPDKVPLEWGPTAKTGLPAKSHAVCKWRIRLHREDIVEVHGFVKTRTLDDIVELVRRDIAGTDASGSA